MRLFEPLMIRGMGLKNRIVMAPMQLNVGLRSERARAIYVERARGGVGVIILPGISVDVFLSDEAWGKPGGVASFLEGARRMAEAVHEAGAKVGIQLWHGNKFPAGTGLPGGKGDMVAPSARDDVRQGMGLGSLSEDRLARKTPCRALTIGEIEIIIERFAGAAAAASQAGFDFVEVHGAHTSLPCQFFSPADNHRGDRYGGDLKRRMVFGVECARAMRAAAGSEFPVFYRIGAWEPRSNGVVVADAANYALELEKAGVDLIDVSIGITDDQRGYGYYAIPGREFPPATLAHLAAAVKKKVSVPVVAVGRVRKPEQAEAILAGDQGDLVAVGRQLLADPEWPIKAAEGRANDIRPCLSCNTCLENIKGRELQCAVNPVLGKENESRIAPAARARNVLVIGGGPAGMEAARVAALRGHRVTLVEREGKLGGQLWPASVPPYKREFAELADYMAGEVAKSGVEVEVGHEVAAGEIAERKADVIVLAAGSQPVVPGIRGIDRKNVVKAADVLNGNVKVGQQVAVIGGELVACETADFLAERGHKVTIMRRGSKIAASLESATRYTLLKRLAAKKVEMLTSVEYEEITGQGVAFRTREGDRRTIEADTVVLAAGARPDIRLRVALGSSGREVHIIGDAVEPRRVAQAIADGARIGRLV